MNKGMFNTPRYRIKNRCMFSCLEKKNNTTITTLTDPNFNVATQLLNIGDSTQNSAIKSKTTFVKRVIDPQFGRYVGQAGTVLSNF